MLKKFLALLPFLILFLAPGQAHAAFPLSTPNFTATNIVFDPAGQVTSFDSDNPSMVGMNSRHTFGHAWYMNDDNTFSYHSNDFSCDNTGHCSGDLQFDQAFKGTQTQIEVCDDTVCYWSQVLTVASLTAPGGTAPIAEAGGGYVVAEGGSITLSGEGSDPNNDPITFSWDLDNNGSYETSGQNPVYSAAGKDGPATQQIVLRVCDTGNNCTTDATDLTITNAAPAVQAITLSTTMPRKDVALTATGPFADPGTVDTHTAVWNWGDGSSPTTGTVTESNGSGSVANSHTYTSAGLYTITVTVTDDDGAAGSFSYNIFVSGFPLITPNFTATNIVFDPDGQVTSFDSDNPSMVGMNSSHTFGHAWYMNDDNTFSYHSNDFSCDNTGHCTGDLQFDQVFKGPQTQIEVCDDTVCYWSQVLTVASLAGNHAPVVGTVTVSPNPLQVFTAVQATATYTDSEATDTHSATVNWGDGTPTQSCTVNQSTDTVTCSRPGGYAVANVWPVTITVTDGSLSGTSPATYASVYYPTQQSHFNAGQRFSSPAGAYRADTSLTGNVLFGLGYRYEGTMPTAVRQFTMDFQAANFSFNATTVSSLVIASGKATLQGTGTINGSGTYDFLVTGLEGTGGNGKIRVKITDPANNHAVIYDTQYQAADTADPTTSVAGAVIIN